MAGKRRATRGATRKQGGRGGLTKLLLVPVIALAAAVVVAAFFLNGDATSRVKRALIADGLSEDYPNQTLIDALRTMLEKAGYRVDVAEGRQVNLELYEHLTDYDVIILRVHGGMAVEHTASGNVYLGGIFTGVPWSDNYTQLGIERYVAKARPILAPDKLYVAVLPRFWEEKLQGTFPNGSVMVVSSCWATADPKVIAALFDHGLSMYIGWNHKVTLHHADTALYELVKAALLEHMGWEQAVVYVNRKLGPDPQTGAELYYALRSHYIRG